MCVHVEYGTLCTRPHVGERNGCTMIDCEVSIGQVGTMCELRISGDDGQNGV